MTYRENMSEWTDIDGAMYELGRSLGFFPGSQTWLDVKWVFWSANPLGTVLYDSVMRLVALGALEEGLDQDELEIYRWKTYVSPDGATLG